MLYCTESGESPRCGSTETLPYDTLAKEYIMEISARNQLKGTIKQITRGSVNGEVLVDIGGQTVTSSITLASIDRLALKVGDSVAAIVKATDVMIGK